jgi:hypothetical protein
MASQDQTIKSQISLYMLQHNDNYPSSGNLFTLLTEQTDDTGTSPPGTGLTAFGPYLQATPVNPLTNSSTVDYIATAPTTPLLGTSVGTTYGWVYVPSTGEFHGVDIAGNVSDNGQ